MAGGSSPGYDRPTNIETRGDNAVTELTPAPNPGNAERSPTYPQRVHIRERPQWQALLASWDERIAAARGSVKGTGDDARTFLARMAGARDQIADAVKRMPMEVGDMYEEDKHRLEEAVAALERLFARGSEHGLLS